MQQIILVIFALINLILFLKGFAEIRKKNAFGRTDFAAILGIFVWGDTLIIAPFWILVSALAFFFNNWSLFLLSFSVFWVIRSLGEVIYWIQEQFATHHRNPPHTLYLYKLFQNDAVWFIYQIFWQCIFVFAVLGTLFFGKIFLTTL
ncbi:MAG TPA: hypothetical protein VLF20_02085 [Patescibacteria group bacterium]|nr:hypothetical protein [Patescibacteria group bacterium]